MKTIAGYVVTWELWGRPQYGWRFGLYRTSRGGRCLTFGVGLVTWRRENGAAA